jgi:hypothetical protein
MIRLELTRTGLFKMSILNKTTLTAIAAAAALTGCGKHGAAADVHTPSDGRANKVIHSVEMLPTTPSENKNPISVQYTGNFGNPEKPTALIVPDVKTSGKIEIEQYLGAPPEALPIFVECQNGDEVSFPYVPSSKEITKKCSTHLSR